MTDSPAITDAQENFESLQKSVKHVANSMYVVAHLLYEAKYNHYYKQLGYAYAIEDSGVL